MNTRKNLIDDRTTNSKLFGYGILAHAISFMSSNFSARLKRYFCAWMIFTTGVLHNSPAGEIPTFGNHVINIGLVVPCEQMSRIHTFGIITVVTDKKTFRDWAKMNFKRDTMSCQSSSFGRTLPHFSVSSFVQSSLPFPALIDWPFFNFSPKAKFDSSVGVSWIAHRQEYYPKLQRMQLNSKKSTEKEGC